MCSRLGCRDTIESAKQGGKGMAQDAILVCSDWGFELSDVRDAYQGSIHIFNGDEDLMVPLALQRCIKRLVIRLRVLSFYFYCDGWSVRRMF